MTTVQDYAPRIYPNHAVAVEGDLELSEHTTIGHVTSDDRLRTFGPDLIAAIPGSRLSIATVSATEPPVLPRGGEDRDCVIDLPKRRLAAAGLLGGAGRA